MCYVVSLAAAASSHIVWVKTKSVKVWWLTLMFYGGALFGVIDHLWNKELFLISKNTANDLLLGTVIVFGIFIAWSITLIVSRESSTLSGYTKVTK
jgi:hypothetical protein